MYIEIYTQRYELQIGPLFRGWTEEPDRRGREPRRDEAIVLRDPYDAAGRVPFEDVC